MREDAVDMEMAGNKCVFCHGSVVSKLAGDGGDMFEPPGRESNVLWDHVEANSGNKLLKIDS